LRPAAHSAMLARQQRQQRRHQIMSKKSKESPASHSAEVGPPHEQGTGNAPAHAGPGGALSAKEYAKALEKLHVELVKMQQWVLHKGLKVCIIFEGRDGAGKGGTIKALTERVSPRVFRVIALAAPTEREKSQLYVQRYLPYLPAAGEVVIFDRSWYNRAGVERVLGFCTPKQTRCPKVSGCIDPDSDRICRYGEHQQPGG
jgi:polyphosphate kinase 2 (PPK2 family)